MERGWPTTLQARRSDTPNRSRRATTALRRRSGVRSFPGSAPSTCRCRAPGRPRSSSAAVFSCSSSFSRLASSAFIPPYWLRQRCQVDSVISRCRHTSSIDLPSGEELLALGQLADHLLGCVPASASSSCGPPCPILGHRTRTTGGSVQGDPVSLSTAVIYSMRVVVRCPNDQATSRPQSAPKSPSAQAWRLGPTQRSPFRGALRGRTVAAWPHPTVRSTDQNNPRH